jgi:16S rRNA (guanine966-N2)-methyltransferase
MRVISGQCKGRVLFSPKSKFIRPTSDRVKEFIFNYLGKSIENAIILDLYSGTANLTIEALSRGAQFAVLVDNSEQAIRLIYRNLELTNLLAQCQIVKQDVLRYLKKALEQKKYFDFIFADPPYFIGDYQNMVEYVGRDNLLQYGGFFVLEHSSREKITTSPESLQLETTKILGDTAVSFYLKGGN